MNAPPSTLFLHWGPGSHAEVERQLLDSSGIAEGRGGVDWWDQPRPPESAGNAFEWLIDEAESRIRKASEALGRPIHVLAHSFGGELAYQASLRAPERIEKITLLASSPFLARAFLSLGRRLQSRSPEIRAAVLAAETQLGEATFWPLLQSIASLPDFILEYWGRDSIQARDAYLAEAARHPGLDLAAFQRIVSGYFAHRLAHPPKASPFRGETRFVFGEDDPLIVERDDVPDWKARFPQLEARKLSCGHFVHFEQPPAAWLA
jgi:pimeloyl-ACP methyl ester carboxylesterase